MSLKEIISALSKSRVGPLLAFIVLANVFLLLGAALNQIFSSTHDTVASTDCPVVTQQASQVPGEAEVPGTVAASTDPAASC